MPETVDNLSHSVSGNPRGWLVYLKYSFTGAVIAVIAIILRDIIGRMLPADVPIYYATSIVLVYALGILLSYVGHRFFSFSHVKRHHLSHRQSFTSFILIALAGMVSTTVISLGIRYQFPVDDLLGEFGASFAFAAATLLTSIGTFILNGAVTFKAAQSGNISSINK